MTTLRKISVKIGDKSAKLEVADCRHSRQKGLMGRSFLFPDHGMLFAFREDVRVGFWMRDTLIPLSIAFLTESGEIISIENLDPLDETLVYSPKPYRYAIEMAQGWFDKIKSGTLCDIPDVYP